MANWDIRDKIKLLALWHEGHSTAEIGRRIGKSKNAVVGKAHRMDLPGRPSPIRRSGIEVTGPQEPLPPRPSDAPLPPMHAETWGALQGAVLLDKLQRVRGDDEKVHLLVSEASVAAKKYVLRKLGRPKSQLAAG